MPITLENFETSALPTLLDYAAIPCLSPNFDAEWKEHGHLERAAELLANWARQRRLAHFDVALHQLPGRTPLLVVTVEATTPTTGTCVLYGHFDKQPPLGQWSDGLAPFSPVRRGDRLYARGVADDGYAVFSALLAIEAMEADGVGHGRCVLVLEASEESGSPDLEAYLDELATHLGNVELMICLDSGALTYDRLWVTTSLRGMVSLELEVSVLERAQHSGSASGVVPSSFRVLRRLLDRVEDAATGLVKVPELVAEIPDEHREYARLVASEFGDVLARELPVLEGVELMGDSAEDRLLRRTWFPTLSVVGMGGIPEPANAGNVLRTSTTAMLSFRLPPSVSSTTAAQALATLLSSDAPEGAHVAVRIRDAADGWASPPLEPWLRHSLERASRESFGALPGYTGEGGSIPFLASLGKRYPAVQFVATGVLGPDSNAHGIDEMLHLPTAVGVTNAVTTLLADYATHQKEIS